MYMYTVCWRVHVRARECRRVGPRHLAIIRSLGRFYRTHILSDATHFLHKSQKTKHNATTTMTNHNNEEEEEQMRAALHNYFILSHDTLRAVSIPQDLANLDQNSQWTEKPPLPNSKDRKLLLIKGTTVLPSCLRCAVWISSIFNLANNSDSNNVMNQMPQAQADTFATLGKIQSIEHAWSLVVKECFPSTSKLDLKDALYYPLFQGGSMTVLEMDEVRKQRDEDFGVPDEGRLALTKVLICAEHMLGVDFCPMLPDIASLLLTHMSEACAYLTIREMVQAGNKFLCLSRVKYFASCRTFGDVFMRFYPKTAKEMEAIGALSPIGLEPIFGRFFIPIMPYRYVIRIFDLFAIEGIEVIFRFGVALLALHKKALKALDIETSSEWWDQVKGFTYDTQFNFDDLMKKAYGSWGNIHRKRVRFPTKRFLNRRIQKNHKWANENVTYDSVEAKRPLGLIEGDIRAVLGKDIVRRAQLAEWLPNTLQDTRLDLIFSSNEHGRTLDQFYRHCSSAKHTLMLIEVLNTGAIIGAYATDIWHTSFSVYGDGGCFIFKLSPIAEVFPWQPPSVGSIESDKSDPLVEQFMMGTAKYISMGGGRDGSCGIRLNEDLTIGSSGISVTYNNKPLAGDQNIEFDIGVVEVYRFIRAIDGKPLDQLENVWNF